MKKTELIIRITIVILAIFSMVAVILQVINSKTDSLETAYEIITFLVAVVALVLAITQGVYNTRTSNELKEIIREMHQIIKIEKADLKLEEKIAEKIEKENIKIDQELKKR